jgi:hypothetical protein
MEAGNENYKIELEYFHQLKNLLKVNKPDLLLEKEQQKKDLLLLLHLKNSFVLMEEHNQQRQLPS